MGALEWNPSNLRFVEMRPGENQVVSTGTLPLDPERWRDREHLAAQARTLLNDATGRVGRLIASVPLCHGFLRVIELPADTGEVPGAVRWDMSQYLARPAELYALDWQPSKLAAGEGRRSWLAAAYRLTEVETLRTALGEACDIPLDVLEFDATAVLNAFAVNYPEFRGNDSVLIQADARATICIRTRNGEFTGSSIRRFSGGVPAGNDPQERAEYLLQRARGIVDDLWNAVRVNGDPDRVLLCGDLSPDADFRELLKSRLPVPCALLNPYRNLAGPDPAEYPFAHPGAPFAATVGMALRIAEEA